MFANMSPQTNLIVPDLPISEYSAVFLYDDRLR